MIRSTIALGLVTVCLPISAALAQNCAECAVTPLSRINAEASQRTATAQTADRARPKAMRKPLVIAPGRAATPPAKTANAVADNNAAGRKRVRRTTKVEYVAAKPAAKKTQADAAAEPVARKRLARRTVRKPEPVAQSAQADRAETAVARTRIAHRRTPKVEYLRVVVSDEAAQAMALGSVASVARLMPPVAQVRVVDADEVNELDLAANEAPIKPVLVPTQTEAPVTLVSAAFDQIDQQPRTNLQPATPPAAREQPPTNASEEESWLGRIRGMFSRGFHALAALVR